MLKRILASGALLFLSTTLNAAEVVHWTTKIYKMSVNSDGVSYVFLEAPISPNPEGESWDCNDDVAYLASETNPAPNALLSIAMVAYTTKTSIRVGVQGTGENCTVVYITTI